MKDLLTLGLVLAPLVSADENSAFTTEKLKAYYDKVAKSGVSAIDFDAPSPAEQEANNVIIADLASAFISSKSLFKSFPTGDLKQTRYKKYKGDVKSKKIKTDPNADPPIEAQEPEVIHHKGEIDFEHPQGTTAQGERGVDLEALLRHMNLPIFCARWENRFKQHEAPSSTLELKRDEGTGGTPADEVTTTGGPVPDIAGKEAFKEDLAKTMGVGNEAWANIFYSAVSNIQSVVCTQTEGKYDIKGIKRISGSKWFGDHAVSGKSDLRQKIMNAFGGSTGGGGDADLAAKVAVLEKALADEQRLSKTQADALIKANDSLKEQGKGQVSLPTISNDGSLPDPEVAKKAADLDLLADKGKDAEPTSDQGKEVKKRLEDDNTTGMIAAIVAAVVLPIAVAAIFILRSSASDDDQQKDDEDEDAE